MGEYEIISEYSCLILDEQDHITVKARSTHFNPVVFQPRDLESVRFRAADEHRPGYISFHLLDGRVLLARFSEAEKDTFRNFFLVVRDAVLNQPDPEELSFAESPTDEEETRTVLVPVRDEAQPQEQQDTEAAPAAEMPAIPQAQTAEAAVRTEADAPTVSKEPSRAAEKSNGRFYPLLLIGFVLGALYAVFVIAYYAGMSGSLIRYYISFASLGSFSRELIIPHVLAAVAAAVCSGLALLRKNARMSGISALLYLISGLLFPPYAAFVAVQAVLFGLAWKQLRRTAQTEQGSSVHWIYALDGMLGTLAVIALVSSLASSCLDRRAAAPAYEAAQSPAAASASAASAAEGTAQPSASAAAASVLLSSFDKVTLMSGDHAGMSTDEVTALLGTPSQQQDLGDQNTVLTWLDPEVSGASYTVTFTDGAAVRRSYSGLGTLNEKGDIAAEALQAVATDGSYTYAQALADFGQPDSESVSVLDDAVQRYDSWTNAVGDGASFSITFVNDAATDQSSYGMQ